ncbi:Gti1/Pac2 family-domain-containing protein [Fennellomyces sp. T-0311]|nr:Gti1/Pac2 family-domain-containing protein [Fennellomyces sp. T-0311]
MPTNETFHGFVETTRDTLLIFEACRRGIFPKINRRLQERERGAVRSGTVFVFDERESGIKRWTDGFVWSPSRILGNFLIYRELDGRDSTTDKRRANTHRVSTTSTSGYNYCQVNQEYEDDKEMAGDGSSAVDRNRERALVGSLTTSYNFKKGGLIKKTMSIVVNGSPQHLISYYTKEDVLNNRLQTPSSIPELASLEISPDLLLRQSFRIPPMTEHTDMFDRMDLSPRSLALSPYSFPRQQLRRRASDYSEPVYSRKCSKTSFDGSARAMALDTLDSHPEGVPNEMAFTRGSNLGNRGPMMRYNTAPEQHDLTTAVCDPMVAIPKCTPGMPLGYPAVTDISSPQSSTVFVQSPSIADPRHTEQQQALPYHLQVPPARSSRQLSFSAADSPASASPPPSPYGNYNRPIPRKLSLDQQQGNYWQQRPRDDTYRGERFQPEEYHHIPQEPSSASGMMLFSQQQPVQVTLEATKVVTATVIESKSPMGYVSSPQVHHALTAPKDFHHPMQQSSQLEYY